MYQDKPKSNISVRILKIFVKNGIYITKKIPLNV